MIKIVTATESDAPILTELGRHTFIETFGKDNRPEDMQLYVAETFDAEKQLSEILDPNRFIKIAWLENQPIGFFQLRNGPADTCITGKKPIELSKLYIDSRWHGRGIGASLMRDALQVAGERGFGTIWLGVWEKNFKAQAFYKKFGFTCVGQHIFRVGTDDQIDLVLSRPI